MEIPYTLCFTGRAVKKKTLQTETLPEWCNYPLDFAQKSIFYQSNSFGILQQRFNHKPFFIDLVEVNAEKPLDFLFEIKGKQLFMFFMLVGDMSFYDSSDNMIARTFENNFLMSYYGSGLYQVKVDTGVHIALVITIHPEWLEKVSLDYQNIRRILDEFNRGERLYQTMCQGKIDRKLHRWLRKFYNSQKNDIGVFDGFLRMNMALILKHYNELLDNHWQAFDIRKFILDNLTDSNLGLEMISEQFGLSKRALRYKFTQSFDENIQTFINDRRMQLAKKLIHEKKLTTAQVYMLVGYKDESTFRYHFNRYKS